MHALPRKKSRASEIYDALRKLIVTLELPPKEVLHEKDLCDRFEVSRTPCARRCCGWLNMGL